MAGNPNPPTEIQTLIENHINGFNTQNIELFFSVFGETAIIIDGIAPYRWLNPNGPANWIADVEKWRETSGHLRASGARNGVLERGGIQRVRGGSATLTITIKGQTARPDRHPRIYVFKARRGMEDQRSGVGAHVVSDYQKARAPVLNP